MTLKTACLAALGALFIAAPAAVQAQDQDTYYDQHPSYATDEHADAAYHRRHVEHERRGCHIAKRYRYGVFLQRHKRLTIVC
jgi:hypothetical protein